MDADPRCLHLPVRAGKRIHATERKRTLNGGEPQTETERQRHTETETERQRHTETETERQRHTETET